MFEWPETDADCLRPSLTTKSVVATRTNANAPRPTNRPERPEPRGARSKIFFCFQTSSRHKKLSRICAARDGREKKKNMQPLGSGSDCQAVAEQQLQTLMDDARRRKASRPKPRVGRADFFDLVGCGGGGVTGLLASAPHSTRPLFFSPPQPQPKSSGGPTVSFGCSGGGGVGGVGDGGGDPDDDDEDDDDAGNVLAGLSLLRELQLATADFAALHHRIQKRLGSYIAVLDRAQRRRVQNYANSPLPVSSAALSPVQTSPSDPAALRAAQPVPWNFSPAAPSPSTLALQTPIAVPPQPQQPLASPTTAMTTPEASVTPRVFASSSSSSSSSSLLSATSLSESWQDRSSTITTPSVLSQPSLQGEGTDGPSPAAPPILPPAPTIESRAGIPTSASPVASRFAVAKSAAPSVAAKKAPKVVAPAPKHGPPAVVQPLVPITELTIAKPTLPPPPPPRRYPPTGRLSIGLSASRATIASRTNARQQAPTSVMPSPTHATAQAAPHTNGRKRGRPMSLAVLPSLRGSRARLAPTANAVQPLPSRDETEGGGVDGEDE